MKKARLLGGPRFDRLSGMGLLSTAVAVTGFAIGRSAVAVYKSWKDGRKEVYANKNWRGVYVPDLYIKRFEFGLYWGTIAFLLLSFALYMLI